MPSLRRKSRTLIGTWFIAGLVLLLLTLYLHQLFVILLVALQAVVGIWMMRLRCRSCGHPIHMHYLNIFGRAFPYWAPWLPKRCPRCAAEVS